MSTHDLPADDRVLQFSLEGLVFQYGHEQRLLPAGITVVHLFHEGK